MLFRKLKQRLKSTAFIAVASFIIICDAARGKENESLEILFIGNSYTYYNDLPDMLSKISSSFGDSIFYDQHTPGGYSLYAHSQDQLTIDKINQQNWDYVVLQDQSQRPSLSPSYVSTAVFPYAQQLVDLIYQKLLQLKLWIECRVL